MTKLTQKHFEEFKGYCEEWIQEFGLTNYKFFYWFQNNRKGSWASVRIDLKAMQINVALQKDWGDNQPTPELLKEVALHEVLHSLLGRFSTNAIWRHTTEDELDESEHEIIQRLINFINKTP